MKIDRNYRREVYTVMLERDIEIGKQILTVYFTYSKHEGAKKRDKYQWTVRINLLNREGGTNSIIDCGWLDNKPAMSFAEKKMLTRKLDVISKTFIKE